MRRMMKRNFLNAGVVSAMLVAGAMSGCVGYNVYPPEVGTSGFTDPNAPPMYQLMTEAVKWTVKKYPPDGSGGMTPATATDIPISSSEAEAAARAEAAGGRGRFAVSLFSTLKPDIYEYAVQQIGQGAVPLTPETEHLPRYMVSRVQVRGDEAKVDVFKPVMSMGGGLDTSGQPLYQPITVTLRGGVKFWRVTAYRVWSVGTFPPRRRSTCPGRTRSMRSRSTRASWRERVTRGRRRSRLVLIFWSEGVPRAEFRVLAFPCVKLASPCTKPPSRWPKVFPSSLFPSVSPPSSAICISASGRPTERRIAEGGGRGRGRRRVGMGREGGGGGGGWCTLGACH